MPVPQLSKQNILDAMKYIDSNGIPKKNESTKYLLVSDEGKKYPPKYVVAVANHLATGQEITTEEFTSQEAKMFLTSIGYNVEDNLEKFQLIISTDGVTSTDERFTMEDLSLGDNYQALDVYFQTAGGEIIKRKYNRSENRISNQTMPRIAFQVFEKEISELSEEQRRAFPICQYSPDKQMICGIFPNETEYRKYKNSIESSTYVSVTGAKYVIYCWNVFSTIIFAQECLKRFGTPGDKFVLTYREKDEKEEKQAEIDKSINEELVQQFKGYRNPYSSVLALSKNIIFRGAPGTGKSYLAKEVAADIISDGYFDDYTLLTDEQKKQVEFVQFHPSYDYSDFVEGLRPKMNADGSMGFELQDGIFKRFCERARKNYEDVQKTQESLQQEYSAREALNAFLLPSDSEEKEYSSMSGNKFYITDVDDKCIYIVIPDNKKADKIGIYRDDLCKMLESGQKFEKPIDVANFFGKNWIGQWHCYALALFKEIRKSKVVKKQEIKPEKLKKYIFIIDEINRGEISKILGELFFSIDPGYRGRAGEVSTQYSNMHSNPDEKFYIPENVYIIGTMNDIDRSVDSFDFAMRRRFRFVEIKAEDRLEMLESLDNEELKQEAIKRMMALNHEIVKVDDLNENYQIGASYFLKLKTLSFDELWTDCLYPLLQDYVRGMYDEEGILARFAKAYGYVNKVEDESDETAEN